MLLIGATFFTPQIAILPLFYAGSYAPHPRSALVWL